MAKRFHESEFNEGTQVKLAIFRGYIRSWLPVFLTARRSGRNQEEVHLFDFFAGPGADSAGNPGSPRIIQDELKDFCQTRDDMKAEGVRIRLHFSDKKSKHIEELRQHLEEYACPKKCCDTILSSTPFQESLTDALAIMRKPGTANLVIMDQFGVKEVTPAVVNTLAGCRKTDILFFVSSSYIHRFAEEPSIQQYFNMNAQQLGESDYKSIHRHICDYFRSRLDNGTEYHLAPFSIRKGSNIYGVIFGSRNLRGLHKFLEVCWELDGTTGEANYDIDDDPIRHGQLSLFAEDDTPKKEKAYQRDLRKLLSQGTVASPITNCDIYRFTLEKGFLPRHARTHLESLRESGELEVTDTKSGTKARKGAVYVDWKYYRDKEERAVFRLKD